MKAQTGRIWRAKEKHNLSFNFKPVFRVQSDTEKDQSVCRIRNQAPPLPFFCSLENKFRNKFNIYLKLRMGNDEMYRSITETNHGK